LKILRRDFSTIRTCLCHNKWRNSIPWRQNKGFKFRMMHHPHLIIVRMLFMDHCRIILISGILARRVSLGPSMLGVFPDGLPPITLTIGGGYYFIPPIPKKRISNVTEQFFN
jgi:hypothetical protein